MFFEEAEEMANLHNISPGLTCQCDEVHICQQCSEEDKAIELAENKAKMEEWYKPGGILHYQLEDI